MGFLMGQWLLKWLLKDVTRFEVINHNNVSYKIGRCIIHKKGASDYVKYTVDASLQDDNKTLKIFI